LKTNVISPILGLSILGSGLLLFPLTGKTPANALNSELESSASVRLAQVNSDIPTLPVDVDAPAMPAEEPNLPSSPTAALSLIHI